MRRPEWWVRLIEEWEEESFKAGQVTPTAAEIAGSRPLKPPKLNCPCAVQENASRAQATGRSCLPGYSHTTKGLNLYREEGANVVSHRYLLVQERTVHYLTCSRPCSHGSPSRLSEFGDDARAPQLLNYQGKRDSGMLHTACSLCVPLKRPHAVEPAAGQGSRGSKSNGSMYLTFCTSAIWQVLKNRPKLSDVLDLTPD
jgi:hypothetical protein